MANGSNAATRDRGIPMSATAPTFGWIVLAYLHRQYGGQPSAAKTLARLARTSHRTAEKWLAGTNVPTGENFMNLLLECEGLVEVLARTAEEQHAMRGKI